MTSVRIHPLLLIALIIVALLAGLYTGRKLTEPEIAEARQSGAFSAYSAMLSFYICEGWTDSWERAIGHPSPTDRVRCDMEFESAQQMAYHGRFDY